MAEVPASLSSLSPEILDGIASHLTSTLDLCAFSLADKNCYFAAQSHLYQNVSVKITKDSDFDYSAHWLKYVKRYNIHCTTDRSLTQNPETQAELDQRTTTISRMLSTVPIDAVRSLTFDHEFMHAPTTLRHLESVLAISSVLEEVSIGMNFTDKDYPLAIELIRSYADRGCFKNLKRLELTGSYRAYYANRWLLEHIHRRMERIIFRMHESGEECYEDFISIFWVLYEVKMADWLQRRIQRPRVQEYAFDDPCAAHEPRKLTGLMWMLRNAIDYVGFPARSV